MKIINFNWSLGIFEKSNNVKVKIEYGPRRTGDVAEIYSDTKKSSKYLKWKAEKSISDALKSAWNWELNKT